MAKKSNVQPDDLKLLLAFGRLRRQLNLSVVEMLKPLGIGPKQAILVRQLSELDAAYLSELARLTQSDPGATGKAIESLIRKGWAQKTDNPLDRRRWKVSLTAEGTEGSRKIRSVYRKLAKQCFSPLSLSEKTILLKQFSELTAHISHLGAV